MRSAAASVLLTVLKLSGFQQEFTLHSQVPKYWHLSTSCSHQSVRVQCYPLSDQEGRRTLLCPAWPYAVRTLVLKVFPCPCSRPVCSEAAWCPSSPGCGSDSAGRVSLVLFSTWGAGRKQEQPRGAASLLTRHPAQMAAWPAVGPMAQSGSAGPGRRLLIASVAGGSLTAREEEMKGNGGTSYLLLMLSGCLSFQHCKTGTGSRQLMKEKTEPLGKHERTRRRSPRGITGSIWMLPQNYQRLEVAKSAREWKGRRNQMKSLGGATEKGQEKTHSQLVITE